MWQTITIVLQILFKIGMWYFGKKAERAMRVKEISALLKKITKEGDNLADQLHNEMARKSTTDWEDIPIREAKDLQDGKKPDRS